MAVHGFDQSGYMFWRGILADAVAQIEDVLATGRSRLIGGAKGPQRAQHLGIDDFWRGKQHGRIEIAQGSEEHGVSEGSDVGLEDALRDNEVKALVATSALGMACCASVLRNVHRPNSGRLASMMVKRANPRRASRMI